MYRAYRFAVLLGIAVAACSDPNELPPATETNVVDTITLYSLDGTPVNQPSAYAIEAGLPIRTDQFSAFDIVYTVDAAGQSWLLPAVVVGMPVASLDPGLLPQGTAAGGLAFEQITEAPFDGYLGEDSIPIAIGNTYVLRSRIVCNIGVPKYAKLGIIGINSDPDTLSVTVEILNNQNCGYRSLQLGLPGF
jgi:hypothetical protein